MKLNDFIKKDINTKASNYKVVVGNSPKEQELAKEASKVTILESKMSELSIKNSDLKKENDFLKEQVKINQHEKNEFKVKVNNLDDVKVQLVEKENRLTDVLDKIHELQIKEHSHKTEVKELSDNLRETTAKLYGANSELNRIKNFSEKTQDEYNKIRDRNTVLLSERENISKLKAEFEAKSIRLGEELNKATSVINDLKSKLEHTTKLNSNNDKQLVKSSNLNVKLSKDLDKAVKVGDN